MIFSSLLSGFLGLNAAMAGEDAVVCVGGDYTIEFGIGKSDDGQYMQPGAFFIKNEKQDVWDGIKVIKIDISQRKIEMKSTPRDKKHKAFRLDITGTRGMLRYNGNIIELGCTWESGHP